MSSIRRIVVAAAACVVLVANAASAQVIGTFSWQFAPYCNVVTLTVEQVGSAFRLGGYDDMCGAQKRAAASGTAHLNPDGTIGLAITVTRPDGWSVQHGAAVVLPSAAGTWRDEFGGTGQFVPTASPSAPGSPKPITLRGGYAARNVAAAAATPGSENLLATISFGRTLVFAPATRVIHALGAPTTECPGTSAFPKAAPGFLCVYESNQSNRLLPVLVSSSQFSVGFADQFGAVVVIANNGPGFYSSSGTWALTVQ